MRLEDLALIDKFLREELSPEDEIEFQKRMDDPIFKTECDTMSEIKTALLVKGEQNLKSLLIQEEAGYPESNTHDNRTKLKYVLFLIALVFGLVGWVFWKGMSDNTLNEELYATYFVPYPNIEDAITKGSQSDADLSVPQLYELKKFEVAILVSERQNSMTSADSFYVALSKMNLNNSVDAKLLLQPISEYHPVYAIPAKYYLSLGLIKEGKFREATALLKLISQDQNNVLKEKALQILDKMPSK